MLDVITLVELNVAGMGSLQFYLREGGTMGDLWTTSQLKKDENGYLYVNPDNFTLQVDSDKKKEGTVLPKWNLGWSNGFKWRNYSVNVLLTARTGGVVSSPTQAALDGYGVSKASGVARDNGGVPVNNGIMPAETWYTTIGRGGVYSYYIYSATNVRLQELNVGYTFPTEWFRDKVNLRVAFVGRNLWMIYNKAPFDPELTASTGTFLQGIDY
ncbi:MAG: SusC/RagA family protein, partial [Alistipes sp.]|nr:SusC/RagA family protein [Alistipes sp.]